MQIFFFTVRPHSITQPDIRYYTHLQDKFPLKSMRLNLQHSLSIPSADYTFDFTAYCFTWDDWITDALQWGCFLVCPHCDCGPGRFTPMRMLVLTLMQNISWVEESRVKEFRKSYMHKYGEEKWQFGHINALSKFRSYCPSEFTQMPTTFKYNRKWWLRLSHFTLRLYCKGREIS